ncbi:Pycsar system effector family protein [Hymenobacter sp. HD11105]|jgi:predicted metal-dependent HD superfamily phosphohydrolase
MEPTTVIKKAKSDILRQAKAYITTLVEEKLPKQLVYHSLKHTITTVKEARALGESAGLGADDLEALELAAWFHDTGYLDTYDGHEYRSMERAGQWLQAQGYPPERIALIQDMIRATHRNEPRETELQQLLVDADLSSLGREDFGASGELLRAEWETMLGQTYSNTEWAELQLNFLLTSKFRTKAAQDRYHEQYEANVKEQKKKLKKTEKKEKKKKEEIQGTFAEGKRGVETMFRTTYDNHVSLSQMADNKANMMISLNAVILSILITYLGAKTSSIGPEFTRNPILTVPMALLVTTALGSVVSAILSAQPDVTTFKWLKKSPAIATNRRINILFFGNFTKLSLDDFQGGMNELMRNKDLMYTNMITDIYYLGEVLSRKYRLLRISYTIFMVGLILTALSFGIVLLYKA